MFEYPYINQTYMDILWCVPLTRLLTIVCIAHRQELQYVFGYPYINQTYMDILCVTINQTADYFRYSPWSGAAVRVWISLHQPNVHGHSLVCTINQTANYCRYSPWSGAAVRV